MKKLTIGLLLMAGLAACKGQIHSSGTGCVPGIGQPSFIPVDSANKMLSSYLNSINSGQNDTDLTSIIFDADTLRSLLNDTSHGKIVKVKCMLAHTLCYINSGGQNQPCGYRSGKLTLVVAGYDLSNNYVLNPIGKAMNTGMPCPTSCPATGTAASALLPVVIPVQQSTNQ